MKVRSHILSPSVARGIAVMCAAVFVASAHPAQAGINVWTSQGPPGGGYVSALAIDPITPRTLYAGVTDLSGQASSGVFKSTDAGVTWGAANAGLPGASALVIDPITPSTLYAVSGGVFKSTDAGATWGAATLTNPNLLVLAIDPITPRTLYAGVADPRVSDSVFKSTDAGATWRAANAGRPDGDVLALAIDPITPSTLYAAGAATGVFKSTDAGATWGAAYVGIGNASVYALAIDPITPRTLYAAASNGYFKSTDGGSSWTQKVDFPGLPVFDPITPRTLYVGTHGEGVFKSTDGGSSWNALNSGFNGGAYVVALAIDPTEPRRVYAGTSGGVFAIEQISACVGDCTGMVTVAINDLITLVDIALGTAQPSACPNGGLPLGGDVNVAVIIQAVNNALDGCGVGT